MVAKITCCCFPFIFSLLLSICVVCSCLHSVHLFLSFFYLLKVRFFFIWILTIRSAGCFNRRNNLFGFLSVSIRFQIIEFCYRFHGSQLNNNWSLSSDNLFGIRNLLRCAEIIFGCLLWILLTPMFDHRRWQFWPRSQCSIFNVKCSTFIQIRWSKTRNFWQYKSINERNLYSALNIEHSRNWRILFLNGSPLSIYLCFHAQRTIYRSIVRLIDNDINERKRKRSGWHGAKTKERKYWNWHPAWQHDFIIHGR